VLRILSQARGEGQGAGDRFHRAGAIIANELFMQHGPHSGERCSDRSCNIPPAGPSNLQLLLRAAADRGADARRPRAAQTIAGARPDRELRLSDVRASEAKSTDPGQSGQGDDCPPPSVCEGDRAAATGRAPAQFLPAGHGLAPRGGVATGAERIGPAMRATGTIGGRPQAAIQKRRERNAHTPPTGQRRPPGASSRYDVIRSSELRLGPRARGYCLPAMKTTWWRPIAAAQTAGGSARIGRRGRGEEGAFRKVATWTAGDSRALLQAPQDLYDYRPAIRAPLTPVSRKPGPRRK